LFQAFRDFSRIFPVRHSPPEKFGKIKQLLAVEFDHDAI
jgi:hypothetical protein